MRLPESIRNEGKVLLSIPGFHTKRRIVVIESDDWGSIRMPSKDIQEKLIKKGIRVDQYPYTRYDSLASEEDLSLIFEVLNSVKDKNSNPAIITANTVMTNPDFDKIKESNFKEYYFEPFTSTLKRYPEHKKSFNLWLEGIRLGLFRPQFHGREHLNIMRWMQALKNSSGKIRLAFEFGLYDLSNGLINNEEAFMDALNFKSIKELDFQKQSIIEGTELFYKIFGYRSETFIAPRFTWSRILNKTLKNCGIKGIQGSWVQFEPKERRNNYRKLIHFTGQKNELGQVFTVRNVQFEPTLCPNIDSVGNALKQIDVAFKLDKPAIISSHRLNFVGYIDKRNRDKNLMLFSKLLKEIKIKWGNVEFMSSDQLVELINNEY